MANHETSFATPPPIFDEDIVRTSSYSEALSKANRGKTLDDVAASADKAMTFTAILKKTSPQGSYGVAIGSTSDDKHIMYEIKNKDAAMKSGAMALLVNDVITKVGTETLKDASQYTHAEFVQIMKDSHVLLLEIQRPHKDYVAVDLARSGIERKLGIKISTLNNALGCTITSAFGSAVGKVQEGDRLIACNGRLLRTMSHQEIEAFLCMHDHITLTVERSADLRDSGEKHAQIVKNNASLAESLSLVRGLVITRESADVSWGMQLHETDRSMQVVGDHAHPGILMKNDILSEINGQKVDEMTHDQVVQQLQGLTRVELSVFRSLANVIDPLNMIVPDGDDEVVSTATINILRDSVDEPMGFVFGTRNHGGHVVQQVSEGLPAQRAGLEQYDVILAVNGCEVGKLSHDDVLSQLRQTANVEITYDRGSESTGAHSRGSVMGILTDGLGNPQPGESDIMVQLSRASKDVKIGCGIGTNAEGRVLVTDVVVDTLAADAGLLNMDEILSVNGKMVHTMNHDDVVKEMTDTLEVEMLIRRKDEEYGALRWQRPEMSDDRETVELTIDRESEEKGFGFGLGITNSGKHFITGKNASLDSCDISVHDEIIAINGEDVTSVDHAEVVRLIFATGLSLALTVLRDPTFDEEEADKFAAMDATGRDFFEVTLSRTDESASFGFGLGTTPQLTKVITSLTDELEANNELRIADIVEEINSTDVTQLDHEECVELVKGSGLKITFKIARTVVEKEGRDFNRRGSIRMVDPALAAEVEDNRTDSIA